MSDADVVRVARWSRDRIRSLFSERATGIGADQARHVAGMCDRIEVEFLQSGQAEKVQRWIGFIQGWLWTNGFATLDELKTVNTGS